MKRLLFVCIFLTVTVSTASDGLFAFKTSYPEHDKYIRSSFYTDLMNFNNTSYLLRDKEIVLYQGIEVENYYIPLTYYPIADAEGRIIAMERVTTGYFQQVSGHINVRNNYLMDFLNEIKAGPDSPLRIRVIDNIFYCSTGDHVYRIPDYSSFDCSEKYEEVFSITFPERDDTVINLANEMHYWKIYGKSISEIIQNYQDNQLIIWPATIITIAVLSLIKSKKAKRKF